MNEEEYQTLVNINNYLAAIYEQQGKQLAELHAQNSTQAKLLQETQESNKLLATQALELTKYAYKMTVIIFIAFLVYLGIALLAFIGNPDVETIIPLAIVVTVFVCVFFITPACVQVFKSAISRASSSASKSSGNAPGLQGLMPGKRKR